MSENHHHIIITTDGSPAGTYVEVGGQDITEIVTDVSFNVGMDHAASVTLELQAVGVTINAQNIEAEALARCFEPEADERAVVKRIDRTKLASALDVLMKPRDTNQAL